MSVHVGSTLASERGRVLCVCKGTGVFRCGLCPGVLECAQSDLLIQVIVKSLCISDRASHDAVNGSCVL